MKAPNHYASSNNIFIRRLKSTLTAHSYFYIGASSLEAIGELDDEKFKELKGTLLDRTINLTVVATLAVSATVSFLAAGPPTPYSVWDELLPYVFIGCTCGFGIFSAASGLGLIMYLGTMTTDSVKNTKNRYKRCIVVVLMVMPTLFLFIAAGCALIAWVCAVWYGDLLWGKIAMSVAAAFVSILIVMLFATIPHLR